MVLTIEPYFWLLQGCKASLPPWCTIWCASEENFILKLLRRGGLNVPGKRCPECSLSLRSNISRWFPQCGFRQGLWWGWVRVPGSCSSSPALVRIAFGDRSHVNQGRGNEPALLSIPDELSPLGLSGAQGTWESSRGAGNWCNLTRTA